MEHQISIISKNRPKIRRTICSKPVVLKDDFEFPMFPKTPEQVGFLEDALEDNIFFTDMADDEKRMFVNAMQPQVCKRGSVIIRQGDVGDFFYIVERGTVDFVDGDITVGTCSRSESFGELALLYDSPRAVSCIATSDKVLLWKVDQMTFRHMLAHHAQRHQDGIKDLIRKIHIFEGLEEQEIIRLVHAMTPVHWKSGERVVQKGDVGNVFYIIRSGQVKVHDIGLGDSLLEDQILEEGEAFGEMSLLSGEPRMANVTAIEDVETLAMDRVTFEEAIGSLRDIMERDVRRKFIKALPIFATGNLTEHEVDRLVDFMQEVCYRDGEQLATAGKPYDANIWIIRHGRLLVYSSKHPDQIYNLQVGDYFGDRSIRNDPERLANHTAVCEGNLTTWVLTRDDIEKVIGDIDRLGETPSYMKSRQDNTVLLSDLEKRRILGIGAFGKVWLVSDKSRRTPYALKCISKRKIISSGQVHSVMREKELLGLLQHPFILHLVSSYQDEQNLYLLLPVVPGGELFSQVQKRKTKEQGLPAKDAAFYAACVIEAIGHFSQRHVAYRDLKLENVLIDASGYCVIVDLGFAKVVHDKTYTLVGTPEYLAPEIIMSKGHDKAVDYWAFGVLTYELLVGYSPFYMKGSSQMDMFKRIVTVNYTLPNHASASAGSLISKLLVRRQTARLGNQANGHLDVKGHPWFKENGINFKRLLRKNISPPWIPETKDDPFDLSSNFDDYSYEEKEIGHGKRLTKTEQDQFIGF